MVIYIGADHRGFDLKEQLKAFLEQNGWSVVDVGAAEKVDSDDYVDYAKPVAEKISKDPLQGRGILICANGVGVDITANKFPGVRSVLAMSPDHALTSREDD
ncbi:MAG: RpiB/LacA/LacB family sugar-phosphate isomerase, partial [bacterium]|nr:RpiB/LacA/LacB family sugar-phosphate isomerase [bacterium]